MGKWVLFKHRTGTYAIPEARLNNPRVQALMATKSVKRMAAIPYFFGQKPQKKPFRKAVKRPFKPVPSTKQAIKTRFVFRRPRRKIRRTRLTGLEMRHLRNMPLKAGLSTFDVEAHIDKSLTYAENRSSIEKKLKNVTRIDTVMEPFDSDRFNADFERHIDNLSFRASGGDIQAKQELAFLRKQKGRIAVI